MGNHRRATVQIKYEKVFSSSFLFSRFSAFDSGSKESKDNTGTYGEICVISLFSHDKFFFMFLF